jgi:transcriptional antiterminator RfaH
MEFYRSINWFAVHTKPHAEKIAQEYISRLGLDVFLPRITRESVSTGKDCCMVKPLFPCYLFARFCPADHLHSVRYARGVRRVVSAGDVPLPVEEQVIELVRQRLELHPSFEMPTGIHPGEEVVVCGGVLSGLRAIFERTVSDQHRVMLLLNTIHHQARVWIDGRSLCAAKQC